MVAITPIVDEAAPVSLWMRRLMLFGILANSFVFTVVNYWIYNARFLFIATHPGYVAKRPPTISRAISDNLIGDPFAFWITLSAVLLALAMLPIGALHFRATRGIPAQIKARVRLFVSLSISSQLLAAVGMYMLSHFRFPDNGGLHMSGSYLFFTFEALTVIFSGVACWSLSRNKAAASYLRNDVSVHLGLSGLRWKIAILTFGMVISYVVLFVIKDFDLPFGKKAIYAGYVLLEPAVISVFLTYLLSFNFDMARVVLKGRG